MFSFYLYIIRCSDGSLYTGWTTDVTKRIAQHNAGKGAKYTRSRLPVALVYSEKCRSKADAMRREHEIKKLSRAEKLALTLVSKSWNENHCSHTARFTAGKD